MPEDRTAKGSLVAASSLFFFVPRAVMLESSSTARVASAVTSEKTKKKKKEKKNSSVVTESIFRAITSFLESKGLTETLAALRSEAQLENDEECGVPALDLTEMVRKYLELSDHSAVEKSEEKKFQAKEEPVLDPPEKPISNIKKRSKQTTEKTDKESGEHASENGTDDVLKSKDQKKKKKKKSEASEVQVLADETMKDVAVSEELKGKSDHNKDGKMKKKKKGELEKGEDESLSPVTCDDKSRKKKRKRELAEDTEMQNGLKSQSKNNDDNVQNDPISLSMEAKKQKILPSTESEDIGSNGLSMSKQSEKKHSTTAANAFQRVKVDAVEFVDERLQDNSYWAKDGAETGYGAKAQEVLGQVRGRDFRHEKTKKKRGSYRGGQIDFQSHSVKFQYSDGDE